MAWAHHQQVRSKHKAENQERTVGETTEDSSCRGVNREAKQLAANRPVLQGWSVGTGVEVAKNVALAGVSEIVLYDPTPATMADLATNFYIRRSATN